MSRASRSSPPGFTLLEIVVALALASVLMLLVFQTSTDTARLQRRIEAFDVAADHRAGLWSLLEHDLTHARRVEYDPVTRRLHLAGHASLGADDGAADHLPADVSWAVDRERGILLREQTDPAARSNRESWVEPVALGARDLMVDLPEPEEDEGDQSPADPQQQEDPTEPDVVYLPEQATVVIELAGHEFLTRTFHLR